MIKDYELATCGLSCDLCDANTSKIQDAAKYLLKVCNDPMFLGVISMVNPEFKKESVPAFRETLEVLESFPPCPGCQGRGDCIINQCSKEKGINNCSECEFLDLEVGICKAPPEPPKVPMMPPAPIFFKSLSKRYQNWNVENLKGLAKGKKDEIKLRIGKMIEDSKSSRDLIDFSINLFESME